MCALMPCQSIQRELPVSQIQTPRVGPIEAELVGVVSGGDVPVPAGHDVGIHAHRRRRASPEASGFAREQLQFRLRFHVK